MNEKERERESEGEKGGGKNERKNITRKKEITESNGTPRVERKKGGSV